MVSRIKQDSNLIGPEGGILSSTVVPQVQAVFPEGALTKRIRVGLQVNRVWLSFICSLFCCHYVVLNIQSFSFKPWKQNRLNLLKLLWFIDVFTKWTQKRWIKHMCCLRTVASQPGFPLVSQAQPVSIDVVRKLLGNKASFSPIVTLEPRRRKFHKPITMTIPVPKSNSDPVLNGFGGDTPTLRLLCSITG